MAGTINDFRASFKTDLARPSRFDVQFNIPLVLAPYVTNARQLSYRCENADLPGRTLETVERKFGSAPRQKFPYYTNYNESTMSFIVSDDMSEKIMFESWIDAINPTSTYNFNYKASYVSDIVVTQYDVANQPSYQVSLIDAFPIAVNQLDLDWSSDGHHKLTVVFAYTKWNNNSISGILKNVEQQILTNVLF